MSDCFTVNERSMHIEQIDAPLHTLRLSESLIFHDGLALEVPYKDTSSQLEHIIDVSQNVSHLTYDVHFMKDAASSLQPIQAKLIRRKSNEAVPAVGAYHRCIDNLTLAGGSRGGLLQLSEQQLHGSYWPLRYSTNNER